MPINQFNEMPVGQPPSINEDSLVKTVERVWQIITDDSTDTPYSLLADPQVPVYGNQHPEDATLTVRSRRIERQSGSFIEWRLTVEYSNEPINAEQQQNEAKQLEPNPLARPAIIEWEGAPREIAIYRDRNGDAIANSVGDPFLADVVATVYDAVANVTKNVIQVPLWFLDYQGSVNESEFVIDGVTAETGSCRMGSFRLSSVQSENGVQFRTLSFQLHFRSRRDPVGSETVAPEAWILELLDQGLMYYAGGGEKKYIFDESTPPVPITAPVPLDGAGGVLASPSPDTLVFLQFDIHKRRDFNALPLT